MVNPKFSTNCRPPVYGGDSACPPEPPLRFAMVLHYLLWNYRSRGNATAAGAEASCAVASKSVEKNSVRFSQGNTTIPEISGSAHPVNVITSRRPRRDAPAALQLTENSVPGSQEPVTDASRTFTIFHGSGANSRSCPFQQSQGSTSKDPWNRQGHLFF